MAAYQIFLGEPPEHAKRWIFDHQAPSPQTVVTFEDGTRRSYDWVEVDKRVVDAAAGEWTSPPVGIEIGPGATGIGPQAFAEQSTVVSVSIGGGVARVGNQAFANCTALSAVTMSDGVQAVGDFAFYRCLRLGGIVIPASVREVGAGAFRFCRDISSVFVKGRSTADARALMQDAGLADLGVVEGELG